MAFCAIENHDIRLGDRRGLPDVWPRIWPSAPRRIPDQVRAANDGRISLRIGIDDDRRIRRTRGREVQLFAPKASAMEQDHITREKFRRIDLGEGLPGRGRGGAAVVVAALRRIDVIRRRSSGRAEQKNGKGTVCEARTHWRSLSIRIENGR